MSKSIYINVPVKNVAASREFYSQMGFSMNEQMSNEQNAMVILNEGTTLMLVTEDFFKQATERDIADTTRVSEVSLAIQVASRTEVDKMVEAAIAAGGKQIGKIIEEPEYGMYSRAVLDLDGHKLDLLCMTV